MGKKEWVEGGRKVQKSKKRDGGFEKKMTS